MGVDNYTYIGAYISLDLANPRTVKVKTFGCAKCKTISKDRFCSKCGKKCDEYTRAEKKKLRGYDVLNMLCEGLGEDLNDLTSEEYLPIIFPQNSPDIGEHLDSYSGETEFPDRDYARENLRKKHENVLKKLMEMEIPFLIKYGAVPYAH